MQNQDWNPRPPDFTAMTWHITLHLPTSQLPYLDYSKLFECRNHVFCIFMFLVPFYTFLKPSEWSVPAERIKVEEEVRAPRSNQ